MKTGLKLIQIERNQQIRKHGHTKSDDKLYTKNELVKAARFCLELVGEFPPKTYEKQSQLLNKMKHKWPISWSERFKYSIAEKDDIGKLTVAGAFYMAENDRLGYDKHDRKIHIIASKIDKLQIK